mmetsp:Transcript_43829/g.86927  ORF Transcript_43829/g.86927 Transcript_43829/m.86927 type:complete len:236 (+) Transcript_43829:1692-2399(+)
MRLTAQQVCPLLKKAPWKMPSAVELMSQSSSTIAASFPPSSRRMRLKSLEHAAMTLLPIAVEPVKTTFLTKSLLTRTSPGLGSDLSVATTTLRTPRGSVLLRSSPIRNVVNGVCGAGFSTTAFPQANAEAVGFQPRTIGAFQGAITATTPMGLLRTTTRLVPSLEISSSNSMFSNLPAFSKQAAATITSMRVSANGLPLSFVCNAARDSMFSRSSWPHLSKILPRCTCDMRAQIS